jgi:hypothetical protein
MNMKKNLFLLVLVGALFAGCTYYQTAPGVNATTPPSGFDHSHAAAIGAFEDQGVRITSEDRYGGVVWGSRNGIDVTADVRTQADGSVRVEFKTAGATQRDPALIDRVTQSYNRLMGR